MKTNEGDFVHTIETDLDACEAWIEEERRKMERARRHRGRKREREQHERREKPDASK